MNKQKVLGVVGVLGIVCVLSSLFLSFLPGIRIPQAPWEWNRACEGAGSITLALIAFAVVAAIMIKFLIMNRKHLVGLKARNAGGALFIFLITPSIVYLNCSPVFFRNLEFEIEHDCLLSQ